MALIDDIRNAQRNAGERVVMEDLARKGLLFDPEAQKPARDVLTEQAARIAELERQVVSRFDEDRVPTFRQGHPTHELESAMTADDCNAMAMSIDALYTAVMLAYGHLWHTNNEPMAPVPMRSAETAAYEARKVLRDLLTVEQRGQGINQVQTLLAQKGDGPTDADVAGENQASTDAQCAAQTKAPRLAVMAVAQQACDALETDRKWEGYDLEAGIFGPAFSNLLRKWAALEYAAQPATSRATYATEAEGDAYTMGWFDGQGWGFPTPRDASTIDNARAAFAARGGSFIAGEAVTAFSALIDRFRKISALNGQLVPEESVPTALLTAVDKVLNLMDLPSTPDPLERRLRELDAARKAMGPDTNPALAAPYTGRTERTRYVCENCGKGGAHPTASAPPVGCHGCGTKGSMKAVSK